MMMIIVIISLIIEMYSTWIGIMLELCSTNKSQTTADVKTKKNKPTPVQYEGHNNDEKTD